MPGSKPGGPMLGAGLLVAPSGVLTCIHVVGNSAALAMRRCAGDRGQNSPDPSRRCSRHPWPTIAEDLGQVPAANRASHLHDRRWGEASVCSHQGEVCGGRAGEQDLDADKAGEAAVLSAIDASQLAWEARTCPRSAANPGTEPTI